MENNPKLKLLIWCLAITLMVGGVNELRLQTAKPSEVVVVLLPQSTEAVVKHAEVKAVQKTEEKGEKPKSEPKVADKNAEVIAPKAEPKVDNLKEFLGAIRNIDTKLQELEEPPLTVLDKIKPAEKIVRAKEIKYFDEGEIEIYDSEKGVVEVFTVPAHDVLPPIEEGENVQIKSDLKPVAEKGAKTEVKAEEKAETKGTEKIAEAKVEAKSIEKAEVKVETQKEEPKAEVKEETKAEPKVEEKTETKAEVKEEVKKEENAEVQKDKPKDLVPFMVKSEAEPKVEANNVAEVQVENKDVAEAKVEAKPKTESKPALKNKPIKIHPEKKPQISEKEEILKARQALDLAFKDLETRESDKNPVENSEVSEKTQEISSSSQIENVPNGAIDLMKNIRMQK